MHLQLHLVARLLYVCCWQILAEALGRAVDDFRGVFHSRRCLPEDRQVIYPFAEDRKWVLEVNSWTSHRVTSAIAAIILREHAGYNVDVNMLPSGVGVENRIAKRWSMSAAADGDAVTELLQASRRFGYLNLEIWPASAEDQYSRVVQNRTIEDVGYVGYEGRSGWFVSETFARNPAFALTPEFYRAYNASDPSAESVLQAMRDHEAVNCSIPGLCCCVSAISCGDAASEEKRWCPSRSDVNLPIILAASPELDQGYNEELAHSNGFRFALRYVGTRRFSELGLEVLQNGAPQLVHAWRPSSFLTRLRRRGVQVVRVILPTEGCGEHRTAGTGDWSCDFPTQRLSKFASTDVRQDPVLEYFLKQFYVPQRRQSSSASNHALAGGGIEELLDDLAARASSAAEVPSDSEIFETACRWVRQNEEVGAAWGAWIAPRQVPFFADTLNPWYPWPLLLGLVAVSFLYISVLEHTWLFTTLSPASSNKILEKSPSTNETCRTELEVHLRSLHSAVQLEAGPESSPRKHSESQLPNCFWHGLWERTQTNERSRRFWEAVEKWVAEASPGATFPRDEMPRPLDSIQLAHHTFPCFRDAGAVGIPLCRSRVGTSSEQELEVQLVAEECSGGAKDGTDFQAGVYKVCFGKSQSSALVHIPIFSNVDSWQNSCWFQVRLQCGPTGECTLAAPAKASVLLLDRNSWPANIPSYKRGGLGVSLMRYFIYADRTRRGRKWTLTMIAMLWLPVHNVFVSTIVQKMLVDHVAKRIMLALHTDVNVAWHYGEGLLLVLVQLFSLGLHRWADVVQTRNRGRTGGVRQHHRASLLRKFMHLEHSDHWEATDSAWLYSVLYDVDVITSKAYFEVFVLAQSIFALLLSIIIICGLAAWGYSTQTDAGERPLALFVRFGLGVIAIMPLGLMGVWLRRRVLWVAVIARKDMERAWFRSCTWVTTHWRSLYALEGEERLALERHVVKDNNNFVPAHWDARDAMNDTAWVVHWVQGISYCMMLICGTYSLCEYQVYGLGAMEVGTFYALCKIYLSVGKYVGRMSGAFVKMQRAVVSLREVAALLNQKDQRFQRKQAKKWQNRAASDSQPNVGMLKDFRHVPLNDHSIYFEHGVCFLRPSTSKVGSIFAELKMVACWLPLGRVVHVSAQNERVLRTFLGLAAQIIHPTGPMEQDSAGDPPSVVVPNGLKVTMLPTTAAGMGIIAPSIIEQLQYTGAPRELCAALAEALGLQPEMETGHLGVGSSQVFLILRCILLDPDVLCAFRPLAVVPIDIRVKVAKLLRVWQGGGGLPHVAKLLGVRFEQDVYRTSSRTLIVGNSDHDLGDGPPSDFHVNLDDYLWKDRSSLSGQLADELSSTSPFPRNSLQAPMKTRSLGRPFADIFGARDAHVNCGVGACMSTRDKTCLLL